MPPGEGWSRDPYQPAIEGGRLYGRGSGDAKASVAAMLAAAADVAAGGGPSRGRLFVVLGFCEETRDTTMPLPHSRTVDAAVFRIADELDLASPTRVIWLDLGPAVPVLRAADGEGFVNAIATLARAPLLGTWAAPILFVDPRHPT